MRADPSDRISPSRSNNRRRRGGRRGRPRKRSLWMQLLRGISLLTLALAVSSALAVASLRWVNPPTTAFMLQDGATQVRHEWVDFERMSASLPRAVIAAEDQNFARHFGFDLDAIQEAIDERRKGEGLRGASTISQQLSKNLFLWPGKNLVRKGFEAYLTLLLEALISKQRILELYLNVVEFGPGVYGAGAASRVFLGRSPDELGEEEAALFAAVLPNPKRLHIDRPSAYVLERQAWIAAQMPRVKVPGDDRAPEERSDKATQ